MFLISFGFLLNQKRVGDRFPLRKETCMLIKDFDELPPVLRIQDVARVLDIGVGTAYALINSGELPCRRIGARGIIRVARSDLIRYIEGEKPQAK